MHISLDEVKQTAQMAQLSLQEHEIESLAYDLDRILEHTKQQQLVDVTDVVPTTHALDMICPLRSDEVHAHLTLEVALQNSPRREAAFFAVPAILERNEE